ncbi:MAG: hypothetical protein QOF51_2984 [Chloroflexota bacterium]|nr:hypothetical protein [Chloroflexota bacterium]
MPQQQRIEAARAYVEALRTGDRPAAKEAAQYLAPNVVVKVGERTFEGYDAALERITGVWPLTPVFRKGSWSDPQPEGDALKVHAQMAPVGSGPTHVNLTFTFDDADLIARVDQENLITQPLVETATLPDFVRTRVNSALANECAMSVAYVDEAGRPHISLRGSIQVFSDTELSMWIRGDRSGLAPAIEKNPNVAMFYRDNSTRTMFSFMGTARVDSDEGVRRKVYDISPEVERNHEAWTTGVAVIFDIQQVDGFAPEGRVRMRRT